VSVRRLVFVLADSEILHKLGLRCDLGFVDAQLLNDDRLELLEDLVP
jgi:hypothetical protein